MSSRPVTTAIGVALIMVLLMLACKFIRWLWSHECVVGPHPNGRCGICGGSMDEQDDTTCILGNLHVILLSQRTTPPP